MRLRNFKSFQDVRVNLGLRNVLVGPNMAGKSNFIEVFRFLNRVSFPQPGIWGLPSAFTGGFAEFTWKGGDSNLIAISLEGAVTEAGDLENAEWTYEISIVGDERGSIRVQEERLSFSFSGRSDELIVTREGNRSLVNRGGQEIYHNVDSTRAALEFDVPNWDGSFLRRSIAGWRFYKLIPPLMKQVNPASAPPFLTELGDNLSSWLMHLQTRHSDAFAKIQQVCRDVLPGLEDVFTWPSQQATVVVASRERHLKRPISMWQMSDGELAFLALLSLVYSPRELGASLYCVEEPENHLHPRLTETLMELLRQVQDELGPENSAQVIATTHSPLLVDKVSLDELIVFEKCQGATAVAYPRDKAHLKELLQRKELGLGDLFYSGALERG
ncbi:MAG: AAA family ATPase [Acidobacteria bacterium]|nr:AAA family ATPase [Acidobacteriota bacterium]